MTGIIVKINSNRYEVESSGERYNLTARGVLKIKSDGLAVGDLVEFQGESITKILPRKSFFIRPRVANIDVIIVQIAPLPETDFLMIDKMLLSCKKEKVEVIFAVNKSDLGDDLFKKTIKDYGSLGYKVFNISVKNGVGLEALKKEVKGKLTALAGQSAVGKTSLINSIFSLSLKTGELSKIERGKHTTTKSEIYSDGEYYLIDTPGFATYYTTITLEELSDYYPEYEELKNECRFRGCLHIDEPDCRIKEAVEKGIISKDRYERYKVIYSELKERKKHDY